MQTITVDILDERVLKVLERMELLKLIEMRKADGTPFWDKKRITQYMGKMTRQPIEEVEAQLKELRDSWE